MYPAALFSIFQCGVDQLAELGKEATALFDLALL